MSCASSSDCDNALFQVLKECGNLPNFFDAVFGFLNRRTDFYEVTEKPGAVVGLPPHLAASIVKRAFFKWQTHDKSRQPQTNDQPAPRPAPQPTSQQAPQPEESTEEASNSYTPSKQSQSNADCYNGAMRDNYMWCQTINDVDIIVKLPVVVPIKELEVRIDARHISIRTRSTKEVLLVGDLPYKIKKKDALWSLDTKKQTLEIHLDKVHELWWDRLVKGEEPLDVTRLDCSRPFDELPDEAKAKIEELQWNQDRKRMGLPTTKQLEMQATLKKSWDADGTPFTGPFDPDSVLIG